MNAEPAPDNAEQKHYTALVYFHGIGEQKRYEEVSFLIDALDRYEREGEFKDLQPLDKTIEFQFEPLRRSEQPDSEQSDSKRAGDVIGYNRVSYKDPRILGAEDEKRTPGAEYRFYEAYYADLTAGGIRPTEVFLWLLNLSFMPVKILITHWRDLARLRRATLLSGWKNKPGRLPDLSDEEVHHLLDVYNDFVKSNRPPEFPNRKLFSYLASRSKYLRNEGSFKQFVDEYCDPANKAEPNKSDQIKHHAKQWRWRFIGVQFQTTLLVLTFLLTLGLIGWGLVAFAAQIRTPIIPLGWNILLGAAIVFILWPIGWFLRNYVGDLYFWTTYQETSAKYAKRQAILDRCCTCLSHVLLDKENCDRVVVIGHSMGTTVAYDTMLRLARQKELSLDKIQYFVTLASVIDKVYYLFEAVTSKSFRYTRIIDAARKDIGDPPFSEKAEWPYPRIHWINFWDRADVASSALYTPTNPHFHPYQIVDNYEVAGVCFPSPVSAHADYLKNPIVLKAISEVFFNNKYNFTKLSTEKNVEYQKNFIGWQEDKHWITTLFQVSVLLIPWLILLYLILPRFSPVAAGPMFLSALGVCFLIVVALGFLDWFHRFRKGPDVKHEQQKK